MSESYSRSLVRRYWVLALVALLTWAFHASVSRKFSQMMTGMQEASALKSAMRMDELILFDDYRRSALYHLASRRHIQDAYKKEYEAMDLIHRIRAEEAESAALHDAASELATEAENDEKKAERLDYASIGDNLDYIASKLQGTVIEKRAEKEAAEASERLTHADELERKGSERLAQIEQQLNTTGTTSEVVAASHEGLCAWMSWACKSIDRTAPPESVQKISDEAIAIAASFEEALRLLDEAKKERDYAMTLLHKSAKDVNESIAILEEANDYKEYADEEHLEAMELHDKAKKEKQEAVQDETDGELEDKEVEMDEIRLISALNAYSRDVVSARAEAENATALDYSRKEERETIMKIQTQIRSVTNAAKRHVAHAGWYALMSICLAIGLFVLMILRIVNTCQTSEPWFWILRQQHLEIRDISYVYIHVLLLILTMAFSGQLLHDYHRHGILGRIEITTLFALVGSFFQVTLLHFFPNVIRLVSVSSLNTHTFLTLLLENVAKSGIVVFALYILEILFLWVNFGDSIFSRVYRLNGPWLWGFVVIAAMLHMCFIENYSQLSSDSESRVIGSEMSSITAPERNPGTELRSLVDESASPSTPSCNSLGSIDLGSSSSSTGARRPNSMSYGSTQGGSMSFSPEVSSTFISSWSSQMNRLMFLVDILLASWAVWVVRHDMAIIFKLSPLAPRIIWGFFPLWVLDIALAAVLVVLAYMFCKWKQRKQQEVEYRRDGSGSAGRIATTPLLG